MIDLNKIITIEDVLNLLAYTDDVVIGKEGNLLFLEDTLYQGKAKMEKIPEWILKLECIGLTCIEEIYALVVEDKKYENLN